MPRPRPSPAGSTRPCSPSATCPSRRLVAAFSRRRVGEPVRHDGLLAGHRRSRAARSRWSRSIACRFPRPDDPLLQAKRERAKADAFRLVDLSRAATLLAQGAGRLIRTHDDRGVVAVLDPRLATDQDLPVGDHRRACRRCDALVIAARSRRSCETCTLPDRPAASIPWRGGSARSTRSSQRRRRMVRRHPLHRLRHLPRTRAGSLRRHRRPVGGRPPTRRSRRGAHGPGSRPRPARPSRSAGRPAASAGGLYPLVLDGPVSYLGHTSEDSFGADSYLVERAGGCLMVDSPRFTRRLVEPIEAMGGIADILLTHRDDVADADRWAAHFGSRVWIHEADRSAAPYATDLLRGLEPSTVAPGVWPSPCQATLAARWSTPSTTRGCSAATHWPGVASAMTSRRFATPAGTPGPSRRRHCAGSPTRSSSPGSCPATAAERTVPAPRCTTASRQLVTRMSAAA